MITGKRMKEIYMAMTAICEEVSMLLNSINDQLVELGYAANGTGVMWDRSNSWHGPRFWMPYFQQKIWIGSQRRNEGVGVNILFDYADFNNQYPAITCAYLKAENEGLFHKCDPLFDAGWSDESDYREDVNIKLYHNIDDGVEMWYYFLPLETVSGEEKVLQYIVEPLHQLFQSQGNNTAKIKSLGDVVKTVEEIVEGC
ncbi:hypothetical protein [Alicyclobacillus sp. SO9]|uniref:hypothetical protein n=1 Tax=Alicyclobacillus sp. SO9 TaxID=2665646 RepID=UPI0018E72701|nr:hypothetical protein [Alicyclobacillus sp. SO9]QQE80438.1 hypothetical protein GI364_08495 [Alicyclobacillus sp. SO9]